MAEKTEEKGRITKNKAMVWKRRRQKWIGAFIALFVCVGSGPPVVKAADQQQVATFTDLKAAAEAAEAEGEAVDILVAASAISFSDSITITGTVNITFAYEGSTLIRGYTTGSAVFEGSLFVVAEGGSLTLGSHETPSCLLGLAAEAAEIQQYSQNPQVHREPLVVVEAGGSFLANSVNMGYNIATDPSAAGEGGGVLRTYGDSELHLCNIAHAAAVGNGGAICVASNGSLFFGGYGAAPTW